MSLGNYYLLDPLGDANNDSLVCIEDYVRGLEMEDWRTGNGEPVAAAWPKDAEIRLRKSSGRVLTDLISNTKNGLYVSARLRALIEKHLDGTEVEFLPFKLVDHRKRLVSDEYVLVNPIGTVDCLDVKASDIRWDPKKKDRVSLLVTPVLSAKKMAKTPRAIFRIKEDSNTTVINYPIAQAVRDLKYTNVHWQKLIPQ